MSLSRLNDVEFNYGFANDPIWWRLREVHLAALFQYGFDGVVCSLNGVRSKGRTPDSKELGGCQPSLN
jgi:hypothetical protein